LGNIKNDKDYDPFPRTGLVKEYEPFIRARVTDFCKQYPLVDYKTALFEAVKIAVEFEPRFKPELKYDFSTPLRWELKGLKRILVDKEQAHNKHLIHAKDGEVSDEILKQRAADDAAAALHDRRVAEEKQALPVTYGTGGNAAKVAFQIKGVTIGLQLYNTTCAEVLTDRFNYNRGFMDRASADLRVLLEPDYPPASASLVVRNEPDYTYPRPRRSLSPKQPRLIGAMRAVLAHNERMERELDQEAENRRAGDYNSVFLESRAPDELCPDIQIPQPRYRTTKPNIPKTKISEKPDIQRLDPILEQFDHSQRVALLTGAAESLRPALDVKEGAILDWLLSPRDRTLTAVAGEIDITKGYASKIQGKVLRKLHKRMSVTPDEQRKLIEAGCHILDARQD
jgi:hypothetical protein